MDAHAARCHPQPTRSHPSSSHNHLSSFKNALNTAKSAYYANIINLRENNTQTLFSTVNKLLKSTENIYHQTSTSQCQDLWDFFSSKVNIHQQLTTSASTLADSLWRNTLDHSLTTIPTFQLTSNEQITEIIMSSRTSTCPLDPLPSTLVKACLPSVFPYHNSHS